MKFASAILPLCLILGHLVSALCAQEIHPYKKEFADFQTWNSTGPEDINLRNFRPYRAVYKRTYTNGEGQTVNDQVVMVAQRTNWFGSSAILFEYHDMGSKDFKDTNGRTQFYYLDEKTLKMHLAVGPKAGTPLDYTVVRVLDDKITTSRLVTETGDVEFKEFETTEPTFGFRQIRFLMWSALDLNVGDKIKLQPIFNAPQGQPSIALGIVKEQVDYTTPDGKEHRPFVVENTNDPTSALVHKFYLVNEAPYLLAQGLYLSLIHI